MVINNAGIYKITYVNDRTFYIGSSLNIRKRWKEHENDFKAQRHGNKRLQNIFNKYGMNVFKFEVVAVLPKDKSLLWETEQRAIDVLNPG
ncbi:MAG TPA: GIY-YIG nuclease family protein, partial [Bacteroidia bacterium]|nr:GIY-YIG nuclease family protein [Bacteroidia bacterium]